MNRVVTMCLGFLVCTLLSCAVFINDDDGQRRRNDSSADTVTIIMTQNTGSVAQ